ncbi:S-layer homology domain-containing protein [Paenibacillus glycanilyticus]|uniref:S-layer homology domain-containing protein n=1 Tax=Paenibacillus glycanilyticus TaxID=126569 RepID=UPI00203D67E7|nr:S-layer homology domain-containing protein [Paenibacillus glycanilyticus]MCM3627856.1 S-layer homology domain-containing protein [Paenibacillus glycanilyticus]
MKRFNRTLSLLLASALVLPVFQTGTARAAEVSSFNSAVSHYDYFSDVYPHLNDANHVLKTVTYEDLVTLLDSKGTYAVLFGGQWSDETQADIGFINQVAKQYGVDTIYNFDTKLDGESVDIAEQQAAPYSKVVTSTSQGVATNTTNYYDFNELYVELVEKYLTNLNANTEATITYSKKSPQKESGGTVTVPSTVLASGEAKKIESPFLFIYDKDHKDGEGNAAPIIASLEKHGSSADYTWNDFLTADPNDGNALDAAKVDGYKEQVLNVFNKVPAADYDSLTNWDFIAPAFNKHEDQTVGRDIFPTREENGEVVGVDGELVYEHVTYDELTHLLDSQGNYVILFGGSWCPNTQAAIRFIDEYAKKYNVDKVYFWDTKLDAGISLLDPSADPHNSTFLQVRDTNHPLAKLYVDLTNKYLTNIKTQYLPASNNVNYTENGTNVVANKLQVPYLFAYNKDNVNADGGKAPILGHVELMYTWKNIQPDLVVADGVIRNHTNYTNALNKLLTRLEVTPTGLTGVAPTSSSNNNGQITGTKDKALEYKLKSAADSAYTAVSGNAITGLASGTYSVRYAAKNGYNGPTNAQNGPTAVPYAAGQAVDVVVPAYDGPSTPTTPTTPSNPTTPVEEVNAVNSVTVKGTTDSATGETVAVVSASDVTSLITKASKAEAAGKAAVIGFEVPGTADTTSTQLTIPRNSFNSIASGTNAAVKANLSVGTVTFDSKSVETISANAASGDISVIVSQFELTAEGKEVLGDRPVYDLSVFAGDKQISSFGGGKAQVSIPYTLKAGEDPESIIVYYVADSGDLQTIRGQYNAAAGTVNFTTTHFSQYIIGFNKVSFVDVPTNAWFHHAVSFLAARDITGGTDAAHFSPNAELTRGQFIVLLLNAYGIAPEADGAANFADAGKTYYTNYLAAAKRLGIATGSGDNKFNPNNKITRQELFTLLYRSLEQLGELPTVKTGATVASYTDAADIASYAQTAFTALVETGVIKGSGNKLNPEGVSTRAEAAQVLYNLLSE